MSAYQVAVVADETAPAAGTAVVRIAGLKAWPENATLRILPIDEQAVPPNSEGWPWEAIRPVRVTVTEEGVDVVLGPDVVNSTRLLPGTPITIKVGAANLEVEARWPSVAPMTKRRTGAVAMSAAQLLSAKAERERQEKAAAARRQELAELAAKAARDAAEEAQLSRTQTAAPASAVRGTPLRNAETSQLARLLPMRRAEARTAEPHPAMPTPAAAEPKLAPMPNSLGQLAKFGAVPASNVVALPTFMPAMSRQQTWGLRGFAAGLATMAVLIAAAFMLAPPSWLPPGISGATMAGAGQAQIGVLDLKNVFKDLGATGTLSPRNRSAVNVDVATALSLADHNLRGQRNEGETAEAEFWLKRALASSLGGQDVGWALTQLGTIYATAGSPHHSYLKAHTIWELAAAQGDPVAHCFLGALYEHGLGVAQNKKTAREHYLTADALGACRSAKEAAARLNE